MQPPKSFTVEEIEEHFKEKKTMKKNVESVIEKGTLKKSVEALAGTARRQATETVIVPTRKMKEEDPRVTTKVNKNLPQDPGTKQDKEETLLTLRRRRKKLRNNRKNSDDSQDSATTETDRSDRSDRSENEDDTQEKGDNQNVDLEKEVAAGT